MKKTRQPETTPLPAQPEENPAETQVETQVDTPVETPAGDETDTEPQPDTPDAPPAQTQTPAPAPAPPDFETQLAEAENRGYLRGRNERIAELMREPAVYERQTAPAARPAESLSSLSDDSQADSRPMILNNPRVSIWDR